MLVVQQDIGGFENTIHAIRHNAQPRRSATRGVFATPYRPHACHVSRLPPLSEAFRADYFAA